jgi:hypothetical protein
MRTIQYNFYLEGIPENKPIKCFTESEELPRVGEEIIVRKNVTGWKYDTNARVTYTNRKSRQSSRLPTVIAEVTNLRT